MPRAFKLTHSAVSPSGLSAATYVPDGKVRTATVTSAEVPTPAELARREKLKQEGLKIAVARRGTVRAAQESLTVVG